MKVKSESEVAQSCPSLSDPMDCSLPEMQHYVLKSRDITLPRKVCIVKAMMFPVVVYECESWTIKRLSVEELMLLNCGVGEDS